MPTVTVVTANVQHGVGTDGATNYSRQVNAITPGVDIICMQERGTGDTGWNSDMSSAGFSEAIYLENSSSQGDGPAIWYRTSTVTLLQTYSRKLSTGFIGWDGSTNVDKAAVAIKASVNGKQFYVVSTHLCWSACADSSGSQFSTQRVSQINELLNWISTTLTGGIDILIVGDMNFGPDYPKSPSGLQIDLLTANHNDLWQVGLSNATAVANWGDRNSDGQADMPLTNLTSRTHDTRRIDYFFLSKNAATLSMNSIELLDNRATCPHGLVAGGTFPSCSPEVTGGPGVSGNQWDTPDDFGVRPSDHNFIKTIFQLTDASICRHHTSPACI
jgi:endonuclease/exonuclease/phosphatase family metal-dependent hydrolase